jgi:type IV pilus assembly protein PilB
MNQRLRLGNVLVRQEVITEEQLEEALTFHKEKGLRLGEALMELGMCSEADVFKAIANQLGMNFVDLHEDLPGPTVFQTMGVAVARRLGVVPVAERFGRLVVAARNPMDFHVDGGVRQATGRDVEIVVAPATQIDRALENYSSLSAWASNPAAQEKRKDLIPPARKPAQREAAAPPSAEVSLDKLNQAIETAFARGAAEIAFCRELQGLAIYARTGGNSELIGRAPASATRIELREP